MKTFLLSLVFLGLVIGVVAVVANGIAYLLVFHTDVLFYSLSCIGLFILWAMIYFPMVAPMKKRRRKS